MKFIILKEDKFWKTSLWLCREPLLRHLTLLVQPWRPNGWEPRRSRACSADSTGLEMLSHLVRAAVSCADQSELC